MAKLPIHVTKIKTKAQFGDVEIVKYLVTVSDRGTYWEKTAIVDRHELMNLKKELDSILNDTNTAELLGISTEKADKIDKAHISDALCLNCTFKMTHNCITCLFELHSPLERKLFLELRKSKIYFQHQYGLNWNGQYISIIDKTYGHATNNFKDVLTVVDFFIEKKNVRLCVYTDGHTYHERTEDQAQKDRNIDRKLQEMGFQVLRYTGKEVNLDPQKIINEINSWINRA